MAAEQIRGGRRVPDEGDLEYWLECDEDGCSGELVWVLSSPGTTVYTQAENLRGKVTATGNVSSLVSLGELKRVLISLPEQPDPQFTLVCFIASPGEGLFPMILSLDQKRAELDLVIAKYSDEVVGALDIQIFDSGIIVLPNDRGYSSPDLAADQKRDLSDIIRGLLTREPAERSLFYFDQTASGSL